MASAHTLTVGKDAYLGHSSSATLPESSVGEHRELHAIWSVLVNGKKGYARYPETLRWKGKLKALYGRHELLVTEDDQEGLSTSEPAGEAASHGLGAAAGVRRSASGTGRILRHKRCHCDV